MDYRKKWNGIHVSLFLWGKKLMLHFLFSISVWNNVYGFDMSCIKKQAIMEPLVDTVDQNQIATNCQLLKVGNYSSYVPYFLCVQVKFSFYAGPRITYFTLEDMH